MSAHGTTSRYVAGCRCRPYRDAVAAYRRARYRDLAYGRWRGRVDAAPVAAHVQALHAAGMSSTTLAHLSGVATSSIGLLLTGQLKHVQAKTHDAILGVPLDWAGTKAASSRTYLDPVGARRRVHALHRLGFTPAQIAAAGNLPLQTVRRVARAQTRVTVSTRDGVIRAYEQLWDRIPADTAWARAQRQEATAAGWAPPMAWDDECIDNPSAAPVGVRPAAALASAS